MSLSVLSAPSAHATVPVDNTTIPFNMPYISGREFVYMPQAIDNRHTAGDGSFSERCKQWLAHKMQQEHVLMVNSCTSALEIAALLCIKPGDEVIMTPFTYVSTANAVVRAGGVPVFVDIRPDTLNIDEALIEAAITPRTRAIMVVHYAAIACEMRIIMEVANRYNLPVIEDAAHCIDARYHGQELGTIGAFGTFSFHETKNFSCGEGGALVVSSPDYFPRAEIIRHTGTNRSQFFRKEVSKYSWVDIGSAYMMSDLNAAYLLAQFESASQILQKRRALWQRYHAALEDAEVKGLLRRPIVPDYCEHNGHLYYILLPSTAVRDACIQYLRERNIYSVFHYVPLHQSEAAERYARSHAQLPVAGDLPYRLTRLPFCTGMQESEQARVIDALLTFLHRL